MNLSIYIYTMAKLPIPVMLMQGIQDQHPAESYFPKAPLKQQLLLGCQLLLQLLKPYSPDVAALDLHDCLPIA